MILERKQKKLLQRTLCSCSLQHGQKHRFPSQFDLPCVWFRFRHPRRTRRWVRYTTCTVVCMFPCTWFRPHTAVWYSALLVQNDRALVRVSKFAIHSVHVHRCGGQSVCEWFGAWVQPGFESRVNHIGSRLIQNLTIRRIWANLVLVRQDGL